MIDPNITFASSSISSVITPAASFTSIIVRSDPPLTLNRTPFAPSIDISSKGLLIARFAASIALLSPEALPIPISEEPLPCIIAFTSAKSTLTIPGVVIKSEIP